MQIPHFGVQRQYNNLKDELLDASDMALSSGCWNAGPYSVEFSDWLGNRTKANHAILCHSGTQALEIMAEYERRKYLEDPDYHRIRMPNITFPATANAFLKAGFKVDLCDVDNNGILPMNQPGTDILLSCYVGLYGAPIDVPSSNQTFALNYIDGAQHWLIADGNIGDGMAISFDPTKNLPASGNGGALVTDSHDLALFADAYVNNGKPFNAHYGTNSKISEQDCAQLLVRTRYIDQWQERRKQIRLYWITRFMNIHPDLRCMSAGFDRHADQKFVLLTHEHRDSLMEHLMEKGVEVRIHYDRVISEMPIGFLCNTKPDFTSKSHVISRAVLSLPIYPELTDTEVEYIADSVIEFFQ